MKKKTTVTNRTIISQAKPDGLAPLIAEVRDLIQSARRAVASVVDTFQVMTNFEIGRRIVEHEQKGQKRAAYGAELLKELSVRLTEEFGRGFSVTNLKLMRQFFMENQKRIGQKASDRFGQEQICQKLSAKFSNPFTLSWSHYVELPTIKDPDERSFYEIEATNSGWSLPELRRQKASCLYERLALSRDKAGVKRFTHQDLGQIQMCVNHYDRQVKLPEENPTIGLLLCKEKKDAVVKLTLPKDANIHAREYQLYLPSKELLRAKLLEWAGESVKDDA